jgi:hypothetical protein
MQEDAMVMDMAGMKDEANKLWRSVDLFSLVQVKNARQVEEIIRAVG